MTRKLLGKPIADEIKAQNVKRAAAFAENTGVRPTLCVIRVGEREDDVAYEQSIARAAAGAGVNLTTRLLAADCKQEELTAAIEAASGDEKIHGILLFRPLQGHLDEKAALGKIASSKDVDGVTESQMARLYEAKRPADGFFLPCTAESVLQILRYYEIPLAGRKAVVIGRSTVIGKPVSLLLLAHDATVTIAHSRTENLPQICRDADILVCAAGMTVESDEGGLRGGVGREYLSEGQTVIDVGIHSDDESNLFGDVDECAAADLAAAYTPVPGGVGSVTTQLLLRHVIDAADLHSGTPPMPERLE
ncbi:MAG: bifunctional 5,10-methylenetetrahydrofolate dehydrogenase/5,10-methenyltetrahydrofolate cyclohydrolase [Clostridiales Family XIII bacterium]|jgi:methylenetetrahydrofolate dehydrogenase (NADP+)/methenyltetrahydrofolate cyclohydrolase|nr:bifunctional 5,10-methylenetetrahydrofolate dehydrogenase/5,10-methenyltetrahydrofolate cyclohydrolase [Clostridiales Family XIII bacterium]